MRIGIIADPLHTLQPTMDTTLLMAAEAHARGHEVGYADVNTLYRTQDGPSAEFGRMTYTLNDIDRLMETVTTPDRAPLDSFDIISMRQDPPVDERYTAITFLLEGAKVPVVNDPFAVRSFNEKTSVFDVPDLSPPSMTTCSVDSILGFLDQSEHGVILKPLNEYSGRGIERLTKNMPLDEARALAAKSTKDGVKFTMAQHFVPAVEKGDKRFFLIEGKNIGHMNRVPAPGDYRANIHRGAKPMPFEPSARDHEIIEGVAGLLENYDIPMVCIDVIGDYLTEINVTSPSGIPEINQIYGPGHEKPLVDLLERRVEAS